MILLYRHLIVVVIGGNAVFHLEEIVSIAVYVRFRCGGEVHQR